MVSHIRDVRLVLHLSGFQPYKECIDLSCMWLASYDFPKLTLIVATQLTAGAKLVQNPLFIATTYKSMSCR